MLEPHVPAIRRGFQGGQDPFERDLAGSWAESSGDIRDLDVPELVGKPFDPVDQIALGPLHVIHVEQDGDSLARRPEDRIGEEDRGLDRVDPEAREVDRVERLDYDGGADRRRTLSREREVGDCRLGEGLGRNVVGRVPVQRVQDPATGPGGDGQRGIEIVREP